MSPEPPGSAPSDRAQRRPADLLRRYNRPAIATLLSHSALQIFHGARLEGLPTLGIGRREDLETYKAFPRAMPERFIEVPEWPAIAEPDIQRALLKEQALLVPHGSFVEYVGAERVMGLEVPMFGNRATLSWEGSRERQRKWLAEAGLQTPRVFLPKEVRSKVFVKFHGARGGREYFVAKSPREVMKRLAAAGVPPERAEIQEFLTGVRYYVHYFASPLLDRVELLSMDRRIETADEGLRNWPDPPEMEFTVSGNLPLVVREKLLKDLVAAGRRVVASSRMLFAPGQIGPFCLESIYHPDRGFTFFEISARIVAGTNLYPTGSPYSPYTWDEPMSTGRRLAREVKMALQKRRLSELVA